jgi:tetrapyrrole methylase family protein/MazG family protein
MARILRIANVLPSSDILAQLAGSGAVYHADPGHLSFEMLVEQGIGCIAVEDEIPADAEWLVVPVGDPRSTALGKLVWIVDRLLGPGGCPWDREQTHESLKRHLLEEAYEVLDAVDSGSAEKLAEELGDLILQPVMHAQMEAISGTFDIADVAEAINQKLIRRHPHVFGEADAADAAEVLRNWDRIKQEERGGEPESVLAGVPQGMASLLRAFEVSKRAARSGFEWPNIEAVFEKLAEEEQELRDAIEGGVSERVEAEIGDLLFTAVNVARWAGVEPEEALRKMLNRFTERFQDMELLASRPLRELSPEEWDELWDRAKQKTP